MKIGLTPVNFKIIIECVFSDQNCSLFTQLNENCIKQRQGPAMCGGGHFWAFQPRPEQPLSPCWSQSLHMSLCEMLIADFQITLRILGKNSLAGWFMFQCSRYSVLWKQIGSTSESDFLCLPFLFPLWNFIFQLRTHALEAKEISFIRLIFSSSSRFTSM